MTPQEFEAKLRADGFVEIETKFIEPRPANGMHGHHFTAYGMVLDGAFTITQKGQPTTYGPGQTYFVREGEEHCEAVGPEGTRVLFGKKY